MTRVIAIDLGASNGRLILSVLKDRKITLEEIHRFPNEPLAKDGHLYWDIDSIKREIMKGLKKYTEQYSEEIHGIGIDTWGVDFGFVGSDGELLENPYAYRDTHTNEIMAEVHQQMSPEELFQQTGVEPAAINTLYQLAAIQKKRPELIDEAETILTMPSLLGYLLTEKRVNEFTHASTTQLLNLHTGDWDEDLLAKIFGKELPLAMIQPTHAILGSTTSAINEATNLQATSVINVPGHDTACALVAMPLVNEETVFMSCGTWVLMGVKVDKPIVSEDAFAWGFTNEGTAEGTYRFQKNNMGLWLLQQCKREWQEAGEGISYAEESQLLEEATPFQSFIDPDHELFFNPDSMEEAIQTFCRDSGQKIPTTKGELIRCITESLTLKYRWILERMEGLTEKEIPSIHMVGGGIQNQHFCQFTANATEKNVLAGPIEASATGNALSQFIALGEIANEKEAQEISRDSFPMKEYTPEKTDSWNEAYKRFSILLES